MATGSAAWRGVATGPRDGRGEDADRGEFGPAHGAGLGTSPLGIGRDDRPGARRRGGAGAGGPRPPAPRLGRLGAPASRPREAGAEVLCFGDSLVKTGVVPAILESRIDRTVYNLAALGAPTPASYFLLKAALDAGARPRAIVVDAKANQLANHAYRANVAEWAALIGPGDALGLARVDRDPGFFGLHLGHHLLGSVRLRLNLREAILDRVAGRPAGPKVSFHRIVACQSDVNRGAILMPLGPSKDGPDPYPDGAIVGGEAGVCYPSWWAPHPTNLIYLDKLLALAASRTIPVFFVIPPTHPGVQAARERLGLDAAYVAIVRKVRDRYPNVIVVDGRRAGFDHRSCSDARHLNIGGAMAFSRSLAEVIARQLDGPQSPGRWVALPPYAEPRARPAIEDMDESRLALARTPIRR